MHKAKPQELANEFAKGLKTQHDLNDLQSTTLYLLSRLN